MTEEKKRVLFPQIAPKGGLLPDRSGSLECEEVLLVSRSMHSDNTDAALTLRMKGGQRAIEKACELIDNDAHFTCILTEEKLHKLLKMLVGVLSKHSLEFRENMIIPVSGWRR